MRRKKEKFEQEVFNINSAINLHHGDALDFLRTIPDETIQLIVTSPPYIIGKEYEKKKNIDQYLKQQKQIIQQCSRAITQQGSICWQVGNFIQKGEIIPLDILLYPIFSELGFKLRNRIIWHFGHGLHASKRLSGRYEVILWFSKSDDYKFNLDAIRIPQKYPNKKHFKGPKAGQLSGHPMGKNPSDVWDIPNVKSNHIEKTEHPAQFPIELIERLILALTDEHDWVYDPFVRSGTTIVTAMKNNRKGAGSEIHNKYIDIAKERILLAFKGIIPHRPMHKPIYDPNNPQENLNFSEQTKKNCIPNEPSLFTIKMNQKKQSRLS